MHTIDGQSITYQDVYNVAVNRDQLKIGRQALKRVKQTRQIIEKAVDNGDIIYGVTTGFGAFKNTTITQDEVAQLQENLIKSHATGVGRPIDENIVRAMMFLMANYLSKGHSGVRPTVIDMLLDLLNNEICPVVPEKGSVGSSGDLAPSAHIGLALIGRGEVFYKGRKMRTAIALKKVGLTPIKLEAKEGLALINNTACMCAIACFALQRAEQLINTADASGALSAEALRATNRAFDAKVHNLKAHPGQVEVAKRLRGLLRGSTMLDKSRIQDQYSIRCMPQIHGAVREAFAYVQKIVNTEINSVTDNPLIFSTESGYQVISAGNFHGEPVAIAMDTLGIALSELANTADRRVASLLDSANSQGLPPFLAEKGGLNSGMMILQYTTAALVSENKVLAHPASVDSVPTSANVEDLVSMGTIAARKALEISKNVRDVLGIELIVASQAIDFRHNESFKLGSGSQKIYDQLRLVVPYFKTDAIYYPYIKAAATLVDNLAISL